MKKFLAISFIIVLVSCFVQSEGATRRYRTIQTVPTGRSYNNYSNINPYTNDLARIEDYLFGRTYRGETPATRLERIEK